MKKPTKAKKPLKDWVSHTQAEYQQAIDEMVHHSLKVTNSTVSGGGVRVSKSQGLQLPYVSVITQLGHGHNVLMDQYGRGPKKSTIYKQIIAVIEAEAENAPALEASWILSAVEAASNQPFVQCETLSPRLRQILIPAGDSYLSVTPLSAAGIGSLLSEKMRALNEGIEARVASGENRKDIALGSIKRAHNPIGGSNSINIGCIAYRLHSPILGGFPVAQNSFRHALSLHHRGQKSLTFPQALIHEYVSWRNGLAGQYALNQDVRSKHEALIKRFAMHWLRLGQDAREVLLDHQESLPSGHDLVSAKLGLFERGLICIELRDRDWRYQFANRLAKAMSVLEKDDKRLFEYQQSEINSIAKIARDLLP